MTDNIHFLTFELDCDSTLALLQICLHKQGFCAIQSFVLESACASFSDPTCPHHPGDVCECHLITLVVYRDDIRSFPLVLHGHGAKTEIWNLNSQSLPLALDDCLKNVRREEQMLKSRLFSNFVPNKK